MNKIVIFFLITCFFISGCATIPVYKEVFKENATYNQREFPVSKDVLYQTAIKTICSKNFIIEEENGEKGFILAKRSFQKGKRAIVLTLQAKITYDGEGKSTLYLNALQTTEKLFVADRTRFLLWVIPLPGGGGKEASRVKEGEKIIEDKEFYQNFFSAVEEKIKGLTAKSKEEKESDNLEKSPQE